MHSKPRWVAATVLVGLLLGSAPRASADDADVTLSIDLFNKARKASDAGNCKASPVSDVAQCREARDLFRRAYKLNPAGLGALKGQAQVEDALGLVGSAMLHYRELAMRASADPSPEKKGWAKPALEAAARLEPRVPHLKLVVPSDAPKDLEVTLDDDKVAAAAWNVSLDVDPGKHVVRAKGPGVSAFVAEVTLAEKESGSVEVSVVRTAPPANPSASPPASPSSSVAASSPPPVAAKAPIAPSPRSKPDRTLPAITMAVGAVGVGVGLGLGYLAMAKRDEHCNATSKVCDSQDALDSAKSFSRGSTVATILGGAVLLGGAVWYLVAPSSSDAATAWIAPTATASGAGVTLGGSFR